MYAPDASKLIFLFQISKHHNILYTQVHKNVTSLQCVYICFTMTEFCQNAHPQTWHEYAFAPVGIHIWPMKHIWNCRSTTLQECSFTPVYFFHNQIWFCENVHLQSSQECGYCPVCIHICHTKFDMSVNADVQTSKRIWFISCICSYMMQQTWLP